MKLIVNNKNHYDLNEWSSTVGGGVSHSTYVLGGADGVVQVFSNNPQDRYVQADFTAIPSHDYSLRFYIDTTGHLLASTETIFVAQVLTSSTDLLSFQIRYDGSTFSYRCRVREDGGTFEYGSSWITGISDGAHYIDVIVKEASGSSGNDGEFYWYLDGAQQDSSTTVQNFTLGKPDKIRIGCISSSSSGSSIVFGPVAFKDDFQRIGTSNPSAGTTYYLDATSGSDSNNGTSTGTAWQTLNKVKTEFNSGTFGPNDQILLNRGDTFNAFGYQVNIKNVVGTTPTDRLLIGAYGTGDKPVVDCGYPTYTGYAIFYCQIDDPVHHVTIENIEFQNCRPQPIRIAGSVNKEEGYAFDWLVKDCDFVGVSHVGVKTRESILIQVTGCTFQVNEEAIYCGHSTSSTNYAYYLQAIANNFSSCGWEGVDLKPGTKGAVIRKNTFDDCGDSGITVRGENHIIAENVIRNVGHNSLAAATGSNRAGIWCIDSYGDLHDNTIQYNLIEDVDLTVTKSGKPSNAHGIIFNGNGSILRHNTVANCEDAGVFSRIDTGETGQIFNNILYANQSGLYLNSGSVNPTSDYNYFYNNTGGQVYYEAGSTYYTSAQANTNLSIEANSTDGDPGVIDTTDFLLNTSSNAYEAGEVDTVSLYRHDNTAYPGTKPSAGYSEPSETFPFHVDSIDFEAGTTIGDNFSSDWTVSGASIETSGAYSGSNCLRFDVSTSESAIFDFPAANIFDRFYLRFYLNLDNATITSGRYQFIEWYESGVTTDQMRLYLGNDGSNDYVQIDTKGNGTTHTTAKHTLSSGYHSIEVELIQSVEAGEPYGLVRLWIDDSLVDMIWPIENDTVSIDRIDIDAVNLTGSGYLLMDELVIDQIAPLVYSGTSIASPPNPGGGGGSGSTGGGTAPGGSNTTSTTANSPKQLYSQSIFTGVVSDPLSYEIIDRNGNTIFDPEDSTINMTDVSFGSVWPRGYDVFEGQFLRRDITMALNIQSGYTIKVRWLSTVVWEGRLLPPKQTQNNDEIMVKLKAVGHWNDLTRVSIRKWWVDRNTMAKLEWPTDGSRNTSNDQNLAISNIRDGRLELRLVPDDVSLTLGSYYYYLQLNGPDTQHYDRVTYNYFWKSGDGFQIGIYNEVGAGYEDENDTGASPGGASGSGDNGSQSVSMTLANTSSIGVRIGPKAGSGTDIYDQNDFIQLYDLIAYAKYDTSHSAAGAEAHTPAEIIEDALRIGAPGISTDYSIVTGINDNSVVNGFTTLDDDYESVSSIIERLCAYSDNIQTVYGASIWDSGDTSDGLPRFEVISRDVSTPRYQIRLGDPRLIAFSPNSNEDDLYNDVVVKHIDVRDRVRYVTSDTDSSLKDTVSIARYGRRVSPVIDAGQADQNDAIQIGQRYLAYHKDPLSQCQLVVQHSLDGVNSGQVPVARLRAGFALQILGYNDDEIFWIRGVKFSGATYSVQLFSDSPPDYFKMYETQRKK